MTTAMWLWLGVGFALVAFAIWIGITCHWHCKAEQGWATERYGMASGLAIIGVITAVVLAAGAFITSLAGYGSKVSCEQRADGLGVDARWGYFSGCLVERQPGRYVPEGDWSMVELDGELELDE